MLAEGGGKKVLYCMCILRFHNTTNVIKRIWTRGTAL